MRNSIRIIIFILINTPVFFTGCEMQNEEKSLSYENIFFKDIKYQDIPGVTTEEIEAIESVLAKRQSFSYVMLEGTGSFLNADNEIRGFSALVCDWLSSLFGIPFELSLSTWSELIEGLRTGEVDFTNDLTPTPERRLVYYMTDSIAHRPVHYFRLSGSEPLPDIIRRRLPRYAIMRNTTTIDDVSRYAIEQYELVLIDEYKDAYELLKTGEIDAYIVEDVAQTAFDDFGDVEATLFLPLIYSTVSFTTQNPQLAPFISVLQKVLDNGGIHFLNNLNTTGNREYLRHKFFLRLNYEEQEYLRHNSVIPFMAEHDSYPVNFYNVREGQWQGMSFDVLHHIENLTGLEFRIANDPEKEWFEILESLEKGDIPMVAELVRTIGREGRFIWTDKNYIKNQYMLISKADYPDVNIIEVMYLKVGLSRGTAYAEMFQRWFPEHRNTIIYDNHRSALEALMRGEIDLVMGSTHGLLYMMHYLEFPDYKANLIFSGTSYESTFGFNKNETILCSIIDKSLEVIDTINIMDHWQRKSYDYRIKVAQAQRPWLVGIIITLTVIIVLAMILYANNRKKRKIIAEQKIAETASRAKSEFLAKMSHEIRTPMNSVMGFAELASDSESVPEMHDYLKKITDSTKWLLHIINDILDISKIEAGKMELESVPFDLRDVFSRCQSVILPNIKEKGLDLSIYAEPSAGKKLLGDPLRLYQALMNILSNAVKFTDSGTIKFSSTIKSVYNDKATVYFEIKDSGIGMSPAQVNKIFDPFTQADSSTTREYGGSGLGLAITKNIVELMGGKLKAESSPGAGSIFSFELDFETIDAADDEPEDQAKYDMLEKPYFEGIVLVCDDNSMNQEVICAHLARVGLQSIIAENGKIGVDIVQCRVQKNEKPFDLILMDMFMPVMDGMEAASKIMTLDTGTPIVAMTANVMVSELEKYKRQGMPDCLGKPFTSQELWHVLLKYLPPVNKAPADDNGDKADNELQKKLKINFFKNNQTVHARIAEAVAAGDLKLAHRLAHSLKGNAGLIGKTSLRNAAAEVEALLKDGLASVLESKMNILKTELRQVLEELKPCFEESQGQEKPIATDKEQTLALFDRLAPMLENDDTDSINLLDELRSVSGTEELVQRIENFDFKSAVGILANLRSGFREKL